MARQKKVAPDLVDFRFTYNNINEINWSQLSEITGVEFNVEQKKQILDCVDEFDRARASVEQGKTERERREGLEQLRNFLQAAEAVVASAAVRQWKSAPPRADPALASVLNSLSLDGFDVGALAASLEPYVSDLRARLPALEALHDDLKTSELSISPITAGLKAYLHAVLSDHSSVRARGSTPDKVDKLERQRWGVPVGANSKVFYRFTIELLRLRQPKDDGNTAPHSELPRSASGTGSRPSDFVEEGTPHADEEVPAWHEDELSRGQLKKVFETVRQDLEMRAGSDFGKSQ